MRTWHCAHLQCPSPCTILAMAPAFTHPNTACSPWIVVSQHSNKILKLTKLTRPSLSAFLASDSVLASSATGRTSNSSSHSFLFSACRIEKVHATRLGTGLASLAMSTAPRLSWVCPWGWVQNAIESNSTQAHWMEIHGLLAVHQMGTLELSYRLKRGAVARLASPVPRRGVAQFCRR